MGVRVYSPSEQRAIVARYAVQGSYRVTALLHRKRAELVELALERASSLGVAEYGDASFHKPLERIEMETAEELGDAIFYQALYSARERGAL